MQFFIDEKQRKSSHSTCYLEFQKGHFSGEFWLDDSINISGDLWDRYHLSGTFTSVIKGFDYYGITEVTQKQWEKVIVHCREFNPIGYDVLKEAEPWVSECFKEHDVFTIAGL